MISRPERVARHRHGLRTSLGAARQPALRGGPPHGHRVLEGRRLSQQTPHRRSTVTSDPGDGPETRRVVDHASMPRAVDEGLMWDGTP